MIDSNFIEQLTQKLRSVGALHAVGEQWISCDGTIPPGGVPFCGQSVSRALYADLFAWAQAQGKVKSEAEWQEIASVQDGNCIFYSDGDGSATFRMPCISGYLKGSVGTNDAGKWIEEGLPNIEATWNSCFEDGDLKSAESTGAVTSTVTTGIHSEIPNTAGNTTVSRKFSAQTDNPIYGNSDHVTPETNTILVGVYAVSVISNFGSADLADIQTSVANLDVKVNNIPISTSYVTESWVAEDGLSWYRKYSDGWIEQGGKTKNVTNAGITVTMPLAFSSTNYRVLATVESTVPSNEDGITINPTSESTFFVWGRVYGNGNLNKPMSWFACGY